uniref:Magnesium-dependent phosphatase-1 n=1 Tax=Heterosigma akashiwo TaxID=2829 RepID=A0A7S3YKD3_HETAK
MVSCCPYSLLQTPVTRILNNSLVLVAVTLLICLSSAFTFNLGQKHEKFCAVETDRAADSATALYARSKGRQDGGRQQPAAAAQNPAAHNPRLGKTIPRLVVFDLDFTVWRPEMYELAGAPFTRTEDGRVFDRAWEEVRPFPDVRAVLERISTSAEFAGCEVAAASRTDRVAWAQECLRLLDAHGGGGRMADVFRYKEIYPGTKTRHFERLRAVSGVDYEDMLFFDDW